MALCAGACAHAVPVTYTLSGTISGELAVTGFTSTQFVFTGKSDSELLESPDPGASLAPLETLVIELAGIGSFDALNKTYFFTNRGLGVAGFLDQLEGNLSISRRPASPATTARRRSMRSRSRPTTSGSSTPVVAC